MVGTSADPLPAEKVARHALDGGVMIEVYAHELSVRDAALPVWTCVTDGLAALGQPEWVVTVCRGDAVAVPVTLLDGLAAMLHGLRTGRMPALRPGTTLMMTERMPVLPWPDLRALVLFHAQPIDGVPIVGGSLAVVMIRREEFAALDLGLVRWAARRGELERSFPTPLWSDPRHPPQLHPDEATASILGQVPRAYLVGTSVTQYQAPAGAQLVLDVEPHAAAGLAELARRQAGGFAVVAELSPRADACLVWRPGQTEPVAISDGEAGGGCLGGNFLLLAPTNEDGLRLLEDGFCVTLREPAWTRLRAALRAAQAIDLPLGDTTLIIRFLDRPAPRTIAVGEFPPLAVDANHSGRMLAEIFMLTRLPESGRAATPAALAAFFAALEETAVRYEDTSDRRGPAAAVAVDFLLDAIQPAVFRVSAVGLADATGYLEGLGERIRREAGLPRVLAPLVFRAVLRLPDNR